MKRALLSLIWLLAAPHSMAANERFQIIDPFQTAPSLACGESVFQAFIVPVLNQVVVGTGPVTLLTMQAAHSLGTDQTSNEVVYDFAMELNKLRGANLQSASFQRAWKRVTQNEKPTRLVVCLLSDGCMLMRDRGAFYLQFSVDPDEIVPTPPKKDIGSGANKKKASAKGAPRKRASRMKVLPQAKRGEKVDEPVEPVEPEDPFEVVEEVIVETKDLPRILVVNHTYAKDAYLEGTLQIGIVRGIVRYNEDRRFEEWVALNRKKTNTLQADPLFQSVKGNLLKFHRLLADAASFQAELEVHARYLSADRLREIDEATRKFMFQNYEVFDVDLAGLIASEITEANVLDSFELLSATYLPGP